MSVSFDLTQYIVSILTHLNVGDATLEYTFVDPEVMIDINRTHLNHDYSTDIITFDLADPNSGSLDGDLYICPDQVAQHANALGHPFETELKIVMIHGILHLLGYDDLTDDDRTKMDARQLDIYDQLRSRET